MTKRKAKSSTNGERNWSELPQDILHLFSKKLPDISDFIRFRAVCKSWQLSAPINDPPPQLPWLLERRQDPEENGIIRFYCLSSGKIHTITCPASCHAKLVGPACRYLLAFNNRSFEMYLLNPLTHDQIHVPFVHLWGFPEYTGPDPIEGGHIVVVSGYMLAFWRPKADDWVYFEDIGSCPSGNVFNIGQFFSNDRETGITDVIDIAIKKLVYRVAPPQGTNPLLKGRTVMVKS